jgi:FtsZ-binding cell division protein ZapB
VSQCTWSQSVQILDALPADANAIASIAAQLSSLALDRASAQYERDTSILHASIAKRDAQITELEIRCESLYTKHAALAQDLVDAHEDAEQLAGHKQALKDTVKELADKVRKLEGFKRLLLSNLAEDHDGVLPPGLVSEEPPDGETLVSRVLANAKPLALPTRPSLVHVASRAPHSSASAVPLLHPRLLASTCVGGEGSSNARLPVMQPSTELCHTQK